jgi:hypothetical protein
MANEPTKNIVSLSELRLSVEERDQLSDVVGDMIAVNVYRELQKANLRAAGGSSSCNIIGNCSSSCGKQLA